MKVIDIKSIIIGVLIAGFSLTIGNEFFIGAELIVGIMLIVLGIFTIRNIVRKARKKL